MRDGTLVEVMMEVTLEVQVMTDVMVGVEGEVEVAIICGVIMANSSSCQTGKRG